jgi:porin
VRASFSALVIVVGALLGPASGPVAAQEKGLFEQQTLGGDWGGMRKTLKDAGVDLSVNVTSEMLANPVGGIRQATIYQGLVATTLTLDLEKLANWPGASLYAEGYQISGRGLSRNAVGNLLAVSTTEALPSTRLLDLWFQQEFLDGQASFRVGQIAFDDEFYISQYSANFINSTFGCPDTLSNDLPSGGPCYPFAVPGARFRVAPTSDLTLSAAVFTGNPAPPGPGDPQVRNSSGTNFLIGEGGFMPIAELAYSFDTEPISSLQLSDIKLGGWYHTAEFPDLRRDALGRSLADPTSNGIPAMHGSNFGAYLVLDKMLWRRPDTATQGLAAFLRVGYAPPDRNLFSLEVDAGLTFKGLFPIRELDLLGVGAAYGRIGYARRLDRDQVLFTGIERLVRDYEAVLELTYQARISPWWTLQPDLQLIFHPGGHTAAPFPAPVGQPIPNALVLGLRSTITF